MTSAKAHKPAKPNKPIAPIHQRLQLLWGLWLIHRLVIYPVLVGVATGASIMSGMMWQVLVLLPALLLTGVVTKGNSPYWLIILSMMTLVYLGSAGVFLVMRIYEHAPFMIWAGFAVETLLLAMINVLLFILLKRLPPMHQQ